MSGADEETQGAGMSAGTSVGAAAPPQAMTETNAAVISTNKKPARKIPEKSSGSSLEKTILIGAL
jgi:hypothetical protein